MLPNLTHLDDKSVSYEERRIVNAFYQGGI